MQAAGTASAKVLAAGGCLVTLRNSKEVSVAGVEQRRAVQEETASCKDFIYCSEEMRCFCRILVEEFTCPGRPFGSHILEDLNFLLLLPVGPGDQQV